MRMFLFATALLCTALAGAMLHAVLGMPWVERVDFDVVGILWLLTNLPKLMGWAVAAGLLFLSGFCVLQARRLGMRERGLGFGGEQRRLAERFGVMPGEAPPPPDENAR